MFLSPFERMIAFRYLRARREEGFISVIAGFSLVGIALGVATLIVVLSVMRGVREEMIESVIGLEGQVTVVRDAKGIPDYDALRDTLIKAPGAVNAYPIVEGQVMASANGVSLGAMVKGIRSEDVQYKPLLAEKITIGEFPKEEGVIMGSRMAEKMGLHIGDDVTLISPEGRYTPAGMVPRIKAYPVTGIFSIGMFAYDNGLIVMPLDEAQLFFKLTVDGGQWTVDSVNASPTVHRAPSTDRVSAIEINGANPDQSGQLAKTVAQSLAQGYRVYDWKSTNGQIFRAVEVQRNVMFLVLTLIILVASFNIIASLIMLVREKGKAIAILRTMGATRASILRIFLAVGMSVGVAGTVSGIALGLLIAKNTEAIQAWMERMSGQKLLADELYFLSSLPAKVDMGEVGMVSLMALTLSLLASLYPARKAARLDPAEALRYE